MVYPTSNVRRRACIVSMHADFFYICSRTMCKFSKILIRASHAKEKATNYAVIYDAVIKKSSYSKEIHTYHNLLEIHYFWFFNKVETINHPIPSTLVPVITPATIIFLFSQYRKISGKITRNNYMIRLTKI